MGKIYCTECGTELEDTVKFCSNCGTPLSDKKTTPNSNKAKSNNNISTDSNTKKTSKKSSNIKIILGGIVCIILIFIGMGVVGTLMNNSSSEVTTADENTSEPLSPSFTDTIYGINFKIPEGYETIDGTDNQNKGTMITCDRTYMGPGGNTIIISVSKAQGSFYWDLNQNRKYDDVEQTVNGHHGVLSSSDTFTYVDDDKLVVIVGADEKDLGNIIVD